MDPDIIDWDNLPEKNEGDHICENEGCSHVGFACRLPGEYNNETKQFEEDEIEYLCAEHAQEEGYCMGCGEFIAGTGMEFTNNGYCDNCWDEITSNEVDEDEEDYPDGSLDY